MNALPHIFDLDPPALEALFAAWAWPRFRAKQVLDWVYRKGVADPRKMTNLANADRELLAQKMRWVTGRMIRHQQATDGVQKLLVQWDTVERARAAVSRAADGDEDEALRCAPRLTEDQCVALPMASVDDPAKQTECVMIPAAELDDDPDRIFARKTACISSQVGCPVGCHFCASGLGGLDGNLTAGQIVEQVWQLAQLPGVGRITNVVFMGMGEPLSNFDQVVRAVRTLMADWGLGISGRRITISTVGLPAQIRRLAELELPVTLAISLHAPNDEIRRQIIPWAQFVSIDQLIEAGRTYFDRTGREITLEYILLRGLNDQTQHARELAHVARQLRSNVNLIRYNEVKGLPFGRPATDDVRQFQAILRKAGVNTHIRASRGRDIAAACGQLRHEGQQ